MATPLHDRRATAILNGIPPSSLGFPLSISRKLERVAQVVLVVHDSDTGRNGRLRPHHQQISILLSVETMLGRIGGGKSSEG